VEVKDNPVKDPGAFSGEDVVTRKR
jgi:hypothetical protein